jgi:6-methylsalicylate decarboxylase
MERTDVHQHLLGQPLIAALAQRRRPPALIRRRDGWTFRLAGEADSVLTIDATDARLRHAELRRDGVDRALVALSSALGIETLPGEEAVPLLAAYQRGVEALRAPFGAWGAVQLEAPDPAEVDALIARGVVGLSLPATALATPAALERVGPLLARLEAHDAPLFVHPGPVAPGRGGGAVPSWWPGLTDYVAQMQAAWLAFAHAGRRAHPRLRVLFAMLAGGASLQLERLAARGGPAGVVRDPLVFYDTSSYGPRMLRAAIAVVGAGQLVHGSDRPVVEPLVPSGDTALGHALLRVNPSRLLRRVRVEVAA